MIILFRRDWIMNLKLKTWKVMEDGKKNKTIVGSYSIMQGNQEIAKQEFNEGYSCVDIAIPAELLVEVQALDEKIQKAITDNFNE
jgi:hypothetical protein